MNTSAGDGVATANQTFIRNFPAEAARAVDDLRKRAAIDFLNRQSAQAVSAIWPYLSPARVDEILPELDKDLIADVLELLEPGICAAILRRMPERQRQIYLDLMSDGAAIEIQTFMSYPPNSAGRIMDGKFLTFRDDQSADSTLSQLRQLKPKDMRQLLIIDDEQRLKSVVDIQDLAVAESEALLSSISKPPRATVSPFDSREFVAEKLKEFSLEMLPVVDVSNRLIGLIRHGALLQTLREQTSADIQKMVGVSKEERALSSPLLAVRKRLPWMQINLATAFLAASVVGFFEDTIAMFTALAVLLPVVAGQSGNAGAQALAVTMRGLALREITGRHWLRVTLKEAGVGLLNGIAIAITTALGVYFWSRSLGLSFVIGIAMVISMICAGLAGALIPIGLIRIGQDPAQSSSIILTTVTDVAGFISFLGIATILADLL